MARVIDAGTLAQLQAGRIARADMLLFDFPAPTGQRAYFSGQGVLTWSGIDFVGAGNLFHISAIGGVSDGTAVGLAIRLNGDARAGLDASTLASIESVQYRGAPCLVYRAYLHPDTYALLSVEGVFRGRVDTISHNVTEGGEVYMEAAVESMAIDLGRSGYRMRTDIDQRLIDPSDGSLRHVQVTATQEVKWSKFPAATKQKKKFLGLF
ncbi:hypothetical protein [Bosea lathyri]|uniref:Uncharacterized protein n=1 Tax=Bosea lathyri TaxID=1036778 RepID=A0A1H6BF21_9HYPH|nr:hypothetical protein [Bosea lathyri]SEG59194.1 hypothetical protein SAMN04488115_107182 [Bosea lathyri]